MLQLRFFDLEERMATRPQLPVAARVVAIDEKSVDKYGQWPWPRTLMADLIRRIASGAPSVVGVDIIFSEPDRFSPDKLVAEVPEIPAQLARELNALPSNEVKLAEAFKLAPMVLAVGTAEHLPRGRRGPSRFTMIRESGGDPRPFLPPYPALRSLPELTAVERGRGSDIGAPDSDGIVRRIPLFVVADGNLMPALSLEMVRVASGAGSIEVLTSRTGIRGAVAGDRFIPTDMQGRAYPFFTPAGEDDYISAADILDGSYDVSKLRGAPVFLGVTSEGLENKRETPAGLLPGIEVHAQLYESIVNGNMLWRPAIVALLEVALTIVNGLLTIFAVPYRRPSFAIALVTIAVLLLLGFEFVSLQFFNLLADTIYSAITALVVFGFMLGSNLRSAEAERRVLSSDLEHERHMEARMEGELKAASAIQMGLLPRRFPGPPQQRDVEVYALLDPAREVGGDLYDFLFLDSGHLAFVIADVAGKGVPAALFMAMTREVIRAALQREGQALNRVFAEANAKISASSEEMAADGADMMFVTVFAGVLDLATGELSYANAGHEEPLVLRHGADPAELKGDSGPPIGALDDYQYQVQRWQMRPGEMLLLYTDGVTEAQNSTRAFYGDTRLKQAVAARPAASSVKEVVELVRQDVRRFGAGNDQSDDITLLAVRWFGPAGAL